LCAPRRLGFVARASGPGFTLTFGRAPGFPRLLTPCLAKRLVSWSSFSFGPSSIPIDYYDLC
jgi:hypothetical protein